ncbi:MAG: DNA/RNA non-specific endonuclease [Streptococcaceae bacterium]|jgi:hypothetical protein|nr:DNA/RNA non-specific endonuclease [Streptococcaceae bacterium]
MGGLTFKGSGELSAFKGSSEIPEKVGYDDFFTKGKNGRTELKANIEFTDKNGYHTITDDKARIAFKETTEGLQDGKGVCSEYAQRVVGRENRLSTDQGGHIFGTQFNGSSSFDNLLPMDAKVNMNGGQWYDMERQWRGALDDIPPKRVDIKVEPSYSGSSSRPNSFNVTYQIEGSREVMVNILNGGQ